MVIEKWYNRWLRLLTMLLPGQIYIALSPWDFGDFRNIFLPNIGEDQKKSYDLSAGPLAGTASYYGKSRPWLMYYVHKKARCGPEIATFRAKTLHFFRVIRLNWQIKIELRGARGLWSSIMLLVTVVSEKCWQETETEETINFFVTFLSLVKFQFGGRALWPPPPLATPTFQ